MMRKMVAGVAAVMLAISLLTTSAGMYAAEAAAGEPLFVVFGDETEVEIWGYNGSGGHVTIPDMIDDRRVAGIGPAAFADKQLTGVTIPDSVSKIEFDAFYNNRLTSVAIPSSVTTIGSGAFAQNRLTGVTISHGVTTIGESAFFGNQLTSVVIPNTVTSMGGSAFSANRLTSVILSENMTAIENFAFGDNMLSQVTIPNRVTSIGIQAFRNNQLTSVVIPDGVTSIGEEAFNGNQLASVTIPSSVTTIGRAAFFNNQLTSITIPGSVASIGDSAFFNNLLTSVTLSNGLISIGDHAFSNNRLTSVAIPNGVTRIGESAFSWNELTDATIADSVTSIGRSAFYNNRLTDVTLPSGLTRIEDDAFGHNQLTSITIPDGVTSIGSGAFAQNRLRSAMIPDGVRRIGPAAFQINELTSLEIPQGITLIEDGAFGSNRLTDVDIPKGVTSIGDGAFTHNQLTSVTIPSSVTSIGMLAFSYNQLNSVIIPASVARIGGGTFDPGGGLSEEGDAFFNNQARKADLRIHGIPGTAAESHASGYGYTFVAEEEEEPAAEEESIEEEPLYEGSDPIVSLDYAALRQVASTADAARAVGEAAQSMTDEQKQSAVGIDAMALFAEEAAAQGAAVQVAGSHIVIDDTLISDTETEVSAARAAVEEVLRDRNIALLRDLRTSMKVNAATAGEELRITVDPSAAQTPADRITVETADFGITVNAQAMREELANGAPLVIALEAVDELTAAARSKDRLAAIASADGKAVRVHINKERLREPIKLSLPPAAGDTTYQTVARTDGTAVSSKYNPATGRMEAWIVSSGTYTVVENRKDFSDIRNKPGEMQEAIRYLASKGIIGGTSATTFTPDGSISRAEIAALVVRALGKLDPNANGGYTDVTGSDWYYGAAGSAKRYGIIGGYEDNTFRGSAPIPKVQIVAIAARTLVNEMKYKRPANPEVEALLNYTDKSAIAGWALADVALATREHLVPQRTGGSFAPDGTMTRGEAAIILKRMFDKMW